MNDVSNNPDKSWLFHLPDQTDPINDYDTREGEMILLFLIFQPQPSYVNNSEYFVKSACHARRSWIMNSDVEDFGVPCRFYVEASEKDVLLPIFEQNQINTDRDIIYFSCPDSSPDANMRDAHRKKMSFITDPRFEDYKWTLVCDADLFLSRGANWNGEKLPVFERLMTREQTYGVTFAGTATPHDEWANKLFSLGDTEENRRLWLNTLERLVPPEHFNKITEDPNSLPLLHAGLHLFPSQYFMRSKKADCAWLFDATQHFDSDELVLSIYSAMGEEIWTFRKEFQIPCVFTDHADAFQHNGLYLSHPRKQSEEYYWRKSIVTA